MADGEGHGQHREPEGQRDAEQSNADIGKGGGQYGTASSAQYKPQRTEALGDKLARHLTILLPRRPDGCLRPDVTVNRPFSRFPVLA
jgi:hypothetical protein